MSLPLWQPRRRLLAIVLFISLVANLFLGGLTLGWMLHLNLWPWQSSYVTEFGPQTGHLVEHLVRNLDSADRDTVIDSVRAHGAEFAQAAKAIREQKATVRNLLHAPQFDRKAAEEAFARMRSLGNDMQVVLGKAVLDAIEKLPPEARQRLAN